MRRNRLRGLGLSTVCEEAKCPNIGECWGGTDGTATATIMIMGDTCTRACRFCAVKTSNAPPALDEHEPQKVADAISAWGLDYVVFTSVDRDDLPDYGSGHISKCVEEVKMRSPEMLVEVLSPDFSGDEEGVDRVVDSGVDVFAHNVETVEELQSVVRDRRAGWDRSIRALERAKESGAPVTKTSLMLGVGETPEQIYSCLTKLRESGVDVVTFGQYMRPSKKHMRVAEYVTPAAFEHWKQVAEQMGFKYVASGPMVRSSYRAGEYFIKNILQGDRSAANVAQPKRKRVAAGA
jgi:lipoic acid synthetase